MVLNRRVRPGRFGLKGVKGMLARSTVVMPPAAGPGRMPFTGPIR